MEALELKEVHDVRYEQILAELTENSEYWIENDLWKVDDPEIRGWNIVKRSYKTNVFLDFSSIKTIQIKNELKFYIYKSITSGNISASTVYNVYKKTIPRIESVAVNNGYECLMDIRPDEIEFQSGFATGNASLDFLKQVFYGAVKFIQDYFDERSELEKDKWHALLIPGVKLSATVKRTKPSISFSEIPSYYRSSVKRYMKNLIYRRSWSFCSEILIYIRYFYKSFYNHGYGDGFQEKLIRADIEKYLQWVAEDYENKNATFRSKAVLFIRNWLDFIQLAEYDTAPIKDVTRLIFDEDIPKRERAADTFEKIKYIPEPVRAALDAAIDEIEPAEMKPVYILLRETGWRGTDILNLRYDRCLDYVWNSRDEEYVPYLYGEITKTGIPLHYKTRSG